MRVVTIDATDVGNRAYLVTDGHCAIAIDPPRPPDAVLEVVERDGLHLAFVLETHLHNDHVSGGSELAAATGARYAAPRGDDVEGAHGLVDGDRLEAGALVVDVVATPGHTPNHLSYAVADARDRDRAGADGDGGSGDVALFSGGSVLVGTVGRTDLLGADRAAELAAAQWQSVRHVLGLLPAEAPIHPTHGFGSFCSATPAAGTQTTVGCEREANPASVLDREPFVAALLAGYGEYPSYYAHMAERNRRPRPPAYRDPVPEVAACELGGLDDGTWVLDVRPRACFAAGHAPGSVAAGLDGPFATYVGWTMPWGTPFALVGADEAELCAARHALAHIGLDVPVTTAVLRESDCSSQLRRATFAELAAVPDGEVTVVDVRRHQEWEASHLAGSVHVPLHALLDTPLPPGPLWLHCAAGYRAVFGASLLRRRGAEVVAVDDSWSQAEPAGLAVVSAAAA